MLEDDAEPARRLGEDGQDAAREELEAIRAARLAAIEHEDWPAHFVVLGVEP